MSTFFHECAAADTDPTPGLRASIAAATSKEGWAPSLRNRCFADSPLEGDGFGLSVPV